MRLGVQVINLRVEVSTHTAFAATAELIAGAGMVDIGGRGFVLGPEGCVEERAEGGDAGCDDNDVLFYETPDH